MNFVPMREVVSFAIGGGWGSETEVDGSVLTRVIRGADFPEAAEQNLSNAPLRWEKESKVNTRSLLAGDIVLEVSGGTKGRPTGRTVLVTQKMVDESVSPLIPASFCRKVQITREVAASKFVYYWLQLMHKSGRAWRYQNQSTGIANFQFEQFLDSEFLWLPSLKTQQAIAAFLGSLDDKIAANQRTASLSRQIVQVVAEAMGSYTSLGELAVRNKRTVKPAKLGSNLVMHYSIPSFDSGAPALEPADSIKSNKMHVERASVLVSKLNPDTPRVWSIPAPPEEPFSLASTEFIVLEPSGISQSQLYAATLHPNFHQQLASMVGGTSKSHQRVKPEEMLDCAVPDVRILPAAQVELLETLVQIETQAIQEAETLAKTRDELLPLLMSGKITVREAGQEAATAGAQIPSEENEV